MTRDQLSVDDVLDRLRAAGARLTTPRRAVIQALVDGPAHPTADDLADRVAVGDPDVHKSTVYRTLDALADLGLVAHVHLGHGRAVYHLTGDDDLHLLCSSCGVVDHVPADIFDATRSVIRSARKFHLDPGHFALPGLCDACFHLVDDADPLLEPENSQH